MSLVPELVSGQLDRHSKIKALLQPNQMIKVEDGMTDTPKVTGELAFPKSQTGPPNRRNVLLAGTAMAATALSASSIVEQAQAQQPAPAPTAGSKPNIVVIMGDDIGWFNIGEIGRAHV